MTKTNVWIVLFVVTNLLGSQALLAQSADGEVKKTTTGEPTVNPKEAAAKKAEAKSKEQTKTGSKSKEEDKTFIPSEEISEDFAVSFPVDI